MPKKRNRVIIPVSAEMEAEVNHIREGQFKDKPVDETYRQVIRLGLECSGKYASGKVHCRPQEKNGK